VKRTTRDFDSAGRLVREVIEEDACPPVPVPALWPTAIWTACTCPMWPCPMHSFTYFGGPAKYTVRFTGQANYSRSHEVAGLHLMALGSPAR
jgi:hypothetical protein